MEFRGTQKSHTPSSIAYILFVQIGPKLAEKIRTPNNKSFKDYLKNSVCVNFDFSPINEYDIIKTIDGLKDKSSCGIDRLSSKLLKHFKYELN